MEADTLRNQLDAASTRAGKLAFYVDHYILFQSPNNFLYGQAAKSLSAKHLLPFAYVADADHAYRAFHLLADIARDDPADIAPVADHIYRNFDKIEPEALQKVEGNFPTLPYLLAAPALHPAADPSYTFPDVVTRFADATAFTDIRDAFGSQLYRAAKQLPATVPAIEEYCSHPDDHVRLVAVHAISDTLEDELMEHNEVTDRADRLRSTLEDVLEDEENERVVELAELGVDYADHVEE